MPEDVFSLLKSAEDGVFIGEWLCEDPCFRSATRFTSSKLMTKYYTGTDSSGECISVEDSLAEMTLWELFCQRFVGHRTYWGFQPPRACSKFHFCFLSFFFW